MSGICKGRYVLPLQRKRFLALEGYVFGALQISQSDVGTIENAVKLVNDVFEASIVYDGNINAAIDAMWGYLTGLTKSQRKKLRNKNLTKVTYPMKGYVGARQQAKLNHQKFHSDQSKADRKIADNAILVKAQARNKRKHKPVPVANKEEFYKSWEWRTLRLEVIKEQGRECQCCGNRPGMFYASGEPVRVVVDHIKPISKFWHLRLVKENLQVLCDECNMGKGNWDETDFRPTAPDEWVEKPDEDIVLTVLDQLNEGTVQ